METSINPPLISSRSGDVSRMSYIDSLRGVAALYVMAGHAMTEYLVKFKHTVPLPFECLKQFTSALAGVMLFFAISGYVIPFSFHGRGWEGARQFIIRRFFRLYPLYWVVLSFSFIVLFVFKNPINSFETIVLNFTMVPKIFDKQFVLHVAWTLAHELLFYLICLVLFLVRWLDQSQKIAILVLVLSGIYWLIRFGELMSFWPPASTFFQKTVLISLPLMFWGTLWRFKEQGKCSGMVEKIGLAFIPLQSILLLASRMFYTRASVKSNFPVSFALSIALAIGIFIVGTTRYKITNRLLIWCGTISYSIYLLHMYVIVRVINFFAQFYPGVPSYLMVAMTAGGLTCLIGAVSYYLIELPSIRFAKGIIGKQDSMQVNRM